MTTRIPRGRDGDPTAVLELLDRATNSLLAACHATTTTDRYVHAYLGSLRAAAALLAASPSGSGSREPRARIGRRRARDGRLVGVWDSLRTAAPEFGEWADYLAQAGQRRSRLEAGGPAPTVRESNDLLRGSETFLGLIRAALGLPFDRIEPVLAVAGRGRSLRSPS